MEIKYRCELCGNLFDEVMTLELRISNKPVMLRAYCSGCWPKTQFAVESFIKRTGKLIEVAGNTTTESAVPA